MSMEKIENRVFFSIKYIHTLVFLNFIITVIFSDCVSDPLNVQIPKQLLIFQFCYLSAWASMAPLCIVILVP